VGCILSIHSDADSELYHVVFEKSNYSHWVFRLLDPDFQHCYIIGESYGGQYWKVINNRRSHLQVDIEPKEIYPTVRDYCGDSAKIVTIRSSVDPTTPLQFFNIFTCVDVIKGVLGINSFFLWTPKQLYRRLINERHTQAR
jgi:carboxypeptidase C (cathepsin A)